MITSNDLCCFFFFKGPPTTWIYTYLHTLSLHDSRPIYRALAIAAKVESFVRETIASYETDRRRDHHGAPTDELVMEMRERARAAGVLTPHILDDGSHQIGRASCRERVCQYV